MKNSAREKSRSGRGPRIRKQNATAKAHLNKNSSVFFTEKGLDKRMEMEVEKREEKYAQYQREKALTVMTDEEEERLNEQGVVNYPKHALDLVLSLQPNLNLSDDLKRQAAIMTLSEMRQTAERTNAGNAFTIEEQQRLVNSKQVDIRKHMYDQLHGCPNSRCPICEATTEYKMIGNWIATLNHNGSTTWSMNNRWAHDYRYIYTLWAPEHSALQQSLPPEFSRLLHNWHILIHSQMSYGHFHVHVVKKGPLQSGYSIIDSLAFECLRRTIICMQRSTKNGETSTDAAEDMYKPVAYFWDACTHGGKCALDARAQLFMNPRFFQLDWKVSDYVYLVSEEGRRYDDDYSAGIIPQPIFSLDTLFDDDEEVLY
jgi:hypothetical protein